MTPGQPRTVHLAVTIHPHGNLCHSEDWEQSCPKLWGERDGVWCGLFESHLVRRDEEDDDPNGWDEPVPRCAKCLALDEPGSSGRVGDELPPEPVRMWGPGDVHLSGEHKP